MLDRARQAGLAVPAGFVVLDGRAVPDGAELLALVERRGGARLAVRSAFGAEDGNETSLAGWFDSFLDVEPEAVPDRVDQVRASADRRQGSFRRDVLIMTMVHARRAGVAFSEPDTSDDVVNVAPGTARALVSGEVAGERLELDRLGRPDRGWAGRLQRLLRAVRREFGDRPWDIEWADDGSTCWLIQLRPITAPSLRNETLTAANHAEILPTLPSQLMTSVIEEAGPDLFDWYRRRVPGLPADRDFLHVKAGRPMINLSLLEDMMRHLGLPTALVAGSIGGGSSRSAPADPLRMARHSPALLRLGLAQVTAVARAGTDRRRVAAIGTPPATSFGGVVDDLHRAYVALVTGMFPLSSAIGPPLGLLRATGTLFEHASRHRTITTELADRLQEVNRSTDRRDLERFLTDFGHRGVYESDIARPRYRDDPSGLLGSRSTGRPDRAPTVVAPPASLPPRTWRGWLTRPVWALAARPLAARERFRHDAMRAFASIRAAAVELAGAAVERDQLRTVDDLWLLSADEVRRLDRGWRPGPGFWTEREATRGVLADLVVPHVIGLHDPVPPTGPAGGIEGLSGIALTAGTVTGVARVLAEPAVGEDGPGWPSGGAEGTDDVAGEAGGDQDGEAIVLVARSIDAGWVGTLAEVDAVVVEIGGDLSHGSILIRELRLPAITNVAGATSAIADGDLLRVDGGAGTVEILGR